MKGKLLIAIFHIQLSYQLSFCYSNLFTLIKFPLFLMANYLLTNSQPKDCSFYKIKGWDFVIPPKFYVVLSVSTCSLLQGESDTAQMIHHWLFRIIRDPQSGQALTFLSFERQKSRCQCATCSGRHGNRAHRERMCEATAKRTHGWWAKHMQGGLPRELDANVSTFIMCLQLLLLGVMEWQGKGQLALMQG